MKLKTNKMTEEELEALCQEDELYTQLWRRSLTTEQTNNI